MTFSTKRGRKKVNRPKIDHGTPELQMKRRALFPSSETDAKAYGSLLGLLWTQGKIDQNMYEAGQKLQDLHYSYQRIFNDVGWKTESHEVRWNRENIPKHLLGASRNDLPFELQIHKSWTQTDGFLRRLGQKPYKAVMKVTVGSMPHETLPPSVIRNASLALFWLDNWLRLGNCDRVSKK